MKILLVDNSKPDLAFFTPILCDELSKYATVTTAKTLEDVNGAIDKKWDAIVLSGSSLNLSDPLKLQTITKDIMVLLMCPDIPVLGICFGMQLMSCVYGGNVIHMEYSIKENRTVTPCFESMLCGSTAFTACFSHGDCVKVAPHGFSCIARCQSSIDAIEHTGKLRFGVQFHPEKMGNVVLDRFVKFCRHRYSISIELDDPTIKAIEKLVVRKAVPSICREFGIDREIMLEIWHAYRKVNDISPIMI